MRTWRLPLPIVALAVAIALVAGPAPTVLAIPNRTVPACPTGSFNPNVDYFPDKVAPTISKYWTIEYHGYYKVLKNTLANQTYLLVQCDTPVPTVSGAKPFVVPAFLVGTSSRTMTRFLERLSLRERILYVPDIQLITSACVLKMAQDGYLSSIPSTWTGTGVNVIFDRGPGLANETTANIAALSVMVSSLYEASPLEKFEWIKFVAAFFNLEALANNIFDAVTARYQCNSNAIEGSFATYGGKRPVVAWMGFNGDSFETTDWTYKSQMIRDAGATAIVIPSKALLPDVVKSLREADVLIDDTNSTTRLTTIRVLYGLGNVTVNSTDPGWSFIKEGRVYKTDKLLNGGSLATSTDFEQSFWAMPDYVQMDLMQKLYPTFNPSWNESLWFRNVGSYEIQLPASASRCPNGDTSTPFSSTWPLLTCIQTTNVSLNVAQNRTSTEIIDTGSSLTLVAPTGTAVPARSSPATTTSAAIVAQATGQSNANQSSQGSSSFPIAAVAGTIGALLAIALAMAGYLVYRRNRRTYMRDRPTAIPLTFTAGPGARTMSARLKRWTGGIVGGSRRRKGDEDGAMLDSWPAAPLDANSGANPFAVMEAAQEKESLTGAVGAPAAVPTATESQPAATVGERLGGRWTKMNPEGSLMAEAEESEALTAGASRPSTS
ncbi:hypothetical protein M427DRAFT_144645 [Gonapodya prolifera JEL478]|uniref:Peptidase A1 domain-containing protein n=1 Tax=Gonapodya prolifera (strain JEL478) TaxID=1344416 RepID=A0A139AJA2_GONPJ|nr:hypothetical protein M427DRAFT_144645 [Gonapodya prolifera JEL478]|eukprot:KXS16867.1 hypothetical protein M427DRAFT_144645 [Gonapodya prolifera JEL478]